MATESAPDTCVIGEWTFRASVFRLERGQESIKLEPRVAQLLSCLIEQAGKPVSRESLMEKVWPGMVVGDEALTNAINKLRKAFDDNRQHPQVIETIPKAGYRLIAKVEPVRPLQQPTAEAARPGPPAIKPQWPRLWLWPWLRPWLWSWPLIAVAVIVTGFIAGLWWLNTSETAPADPSATPAAVSSHPSIAILPFDNLSDDPQQEYFADGVTDDLITRLAKHPELKVIARDSSFFYKKSKLDLKSIASKLNVAHLLHGSIRRLGDQLVINAQLINAGSGSHVWAEQYASNNVDLFKVENEISSQVTHALLNNPTTHSEQSVEIPPGHARAHDYLLLGRYDFYKFATKADNSHAQNMFREAIKLSPDYALAYALLGWTYDFAAMNGWADDRLAALQQAEQLASQAIDLQPELPLPYYVRGLSYREQGLTIKALGEVEIALKYDPNNANAHVLLATLLYYAGRPDVGLERIKEAMELNPHHPYNYEFHLGQAHFILRQYKQAIDAFERGLSSNPSAERLHVWLAASLAQSGNIESAQWEAEQIMLANPEFSVSRMEQSFPFQDPADMKHFTDGLRLAGLK